MATNPSPTSKELATAIDAAPDPIDIKMSKRMDLWLSLLVIAAGSYVVLTAMQFRTGSFPDPLTTRGMPYITGGVMIAGGVFNVVRRWATWSNLPGRFTVSEGKEDDAAHASSALRPYLVMALVFAWCLLARPLGYLIVTPPMLFGMCWLMKVRSPGKLIGFPLGYTLVVWVLFSQLLGIILPLGPLTAFARSLGLTP